MDHARTLNDNLLKISSLNLDEVWRNFIAPRVVDFLTEYGRKFSAVALDHLTHAPFPDSQLHLFLY